MLQSKQHVIYVPGLGDHRSFGQDIAIKQLSLFGITPHYLALGWHNPEGYATKHDRILRVIDKLLGERATVSLIGVSAGASAVLNVFAARKDSIHKTVCISGKIHNPEVISARTFAENPDFRESMQLLGSSLSHLSESDRSRILTVRPWRDTVVPVADMLIEGAHTHSTWIWTFSRNF